MNPGNQAQLRRAEIAAAILCELHFTTGTQYLTSWGHDLPAMGQVWRGLGTLGAVSAVQESERLEYPAVDLTLGVPDPQILALGRSDPATYRRRPVKLWLLVLDDQLRAVDTPELLWPGLMDTVSIVTPQGADEPGALRLRCEQPGGDSRNAQGLRLNDVQQQLRHPGDRFFSRMAAMAGSPQPWLSKRFQRI